MTQETYESLREEKAEVLRMLELARESHNKVHRLFDLLEGNKVDTGDLTRSILVPMTGYLMVSACVMIRAPKRIVDKAVLDSTEHIAGKILSKIAARKT